MFPQATPSIPGVIQSIPLQNYVLLATTLFVIGILGVLTRRNALIIFMSVELMLNAVNLLLIAFSTYKSDTVAIIVMIYRNTRTIDIGFLNKLKW